MVKDQSDSERGNPLPPLGLFPISSKGSFICIITHRIIHTTAFVTPVVEHWLERDIYQWIKEVKMLSVMLINSQFLYDSNTFAVLNLIALGPRV